MRSIPISDVVSLITFTCVAVPIVIIDIRTHRIPDILSIGGFTMLVLMDVLIAPRSLPRGILAAVLAAALFLTLRAATRGLGFGDVKLAALVGLLVGPALLIPALLIAALGGLGFALYAIIIRGRRATERIPFAPFLVAGAYGAFAARITGLEAIMYGLVR